MKNNENLIKYLSNLAVLLFKVHNLHWNVVGRNFVQIHQYTEGLYDKCFERFDEVGEILKMRGNFPPVKMSDYAANATIVELDSKELTVPEVLNIIKEDIAVMKPLAEKIREEASEADDFIVVATFEDYIKGYVKDLWFLDAMMKS